MTDFREQMIKHVVAQSDNALSGNEARLIVDIAEHAFKEALQTIGRVTAIIPDARHRLICLVLTMMLAKAHSETLDESIIETFGGY